MNKWKQWSDQSTLKQDISRLTKTGISKSDLYYKLLIKYDNVDKISQQIDCAISELLAEWMIITNKETEQFQLTENAGKELVSATGQKDYHEALLFLCKHNVWHPDMKRFGIDNSLEQNIQKDQDKKDDLELQSVPDGSTKIASAVDFVSQQTFADEKFEFTCEEIIEKTKLVDPAKMAGELGSWLVANVEQFIDNHETIFGICLNIESKLGMPHSHLFQKLYLSVPDDSDKPGFSIKDINSLYDELDIKLEQVQDILNNDQYFLGSLFKRMAFFYELTGFVVKEGQVVQPIIQEKSGKVRINELIFDPISLTSTVAQGVGQIENGVVVESEGDNKVIVKQEEIPAGFSIELEISFNPQSTVSSVPFSMY